MNHGRDELKLKPGALFGLLPLRSSLHFSRDLR